ncbi:MarR family winged helix-turn-helix transcriptional regulator [Paenibacillus sp. 598K]|uniref:MarR family winged helix-turn-helix transcriptional regulator n=1 Tax=Paenibacillus sp. 598K TaxID=1117987 RepID=UPI000FFF4F77
MAINEWRQMEEIDWYFRKMVRKFVKERDKITVEGIALPGLLILQKTLRDGEQKLSDLTEELDLTSGAITALCDKLEKKNFAIRRRALEDRRTVMLGITDEGRALLARNRDVGPLCIELLFGGLTESELTVQKAIFQQIIGRLDQFSDRVLARARQNEKQANRVDVGSTAEEDAENAAKRSRNTYLSY